MYSSQTEDGATRYTVHGTCLEITCHRDDIDETGISSKSYTTSNNGVKLPFWQVIHGLAYYSECNFVVYEILSGFAKQCLDKLIGFKSPTYSRKMEH